jgi:hypothetical protein
MTTRNKMVHRCDIQRDSGLLGTDEWGNPTTPTWATLFASVACYFWYPLLHGSESIVDGARQVQLTLPMLVLPLGTPVTDDDRILSVTDRRGRVLQAGPLRITQLGAREDCLELKLAETS